jgi:hypothetical protein
VTVPDLVYRDEPAYSLAEVRSLFPAGHPLHQLASLATHLAEDPAIRAVAWEGYAYQHQHLVDLVVLAHPDANQAAMQDNLSRFGTYAAQATGARFRKVAVRLVARAGETRPAYTLQFYWAAH